MFNRLYSLRKSKRTLKTAYELYKKKRHILSSHLKESFEHELKELDTAILKEDRSKANDLSRKVETFCRNNFKKSFFDYSSELIVALILALAIATVVRQTWFELYEIPTGSMRPTFKEQDHLTVSKLAFGINFPLKTDHFYFDPSLVQRGSVVIFTGENIPIIDQDTTYFWLFPYKKRYIKRLIGKPGDSVYFYGGKLYIVDSKGKFINELLDSPWMHNLEHIPFLTFEGRPANSNNRFILFNQMNRPIGRISYFGQEVIGEVFNGKTWVKDRPNAQQTPHNEIQTYSDLFGIRNFAMARLLTRDQIDPTIDLSGIEEGVLYLELRHTPSLSFPSPKVVGNRNGYTLLINPYTTIIPLQQRHLVALMKNMYTARFVVSNGKATRYSVEGNATESGLNLANVPNGTYEFYFGKASYIGLGGIAYELPADHPLYSHNPRHIQKLFNLGIELDTAFAPKKNQLYYPQRYAYFRSGDLHLLGAPILKRGDPTLESFVQREMSRERNSLPDSPYIAFKDYGPPLNSDGSIDKEFIRTFGITVPEGQYLVLGDNHAMSADTRIFGFVPQNNLQGAPSLIIWPPGDRLGRPVQKPYPIFNFSRLIIWSIALVILAIWYAYHRRHMQQPIFKKLT